MLSIGAVLADVFIIYATFLFVTKEELPSFLHDIFRNYWLLISFLIALGASLFSLYYSEIAKFEPCTLCWYQRILMFPLVFLFGLALKRRELVIKPYATLLCIIGAIIAAYHYMLQIGVTSLAPCSASGAGSCFQTPFMTFGYITIPIMSLSTFLLILVVMKLGYSKED